MQNNVIDFVFPDFIIYLPHDHIEISLSICHQILKSLSFHQSLENREVVFDWIVVRTVERCHQISKFKLTHDSLNIWSTMDCQIVHEDDCFSLAQNLL